MQGESDNYDVAPSCGMKVTKMRNPTALTMTITQMLYLAPKQALFCHFLPGVHVRTIPEELLESASSIQIKFLLYFLGITFWHHLRHLSINIDEADNFDNRWKGFFDLKILLYLCLVWRNWNSKSLFFRDDNLYL